jgi:hypothetical protein
MNKVYLNHDKILDFEEAQDMANTDAAKATTKVDMKMACCGLHRAKASARTNPVPKRKRDECKKTNDDYNISLPIEALIAMSTYGTSSIEPLSVPGRDKRISARNQSLIRTPAFFKVKVNSERPQKANKISYFIVSIDEKSKVAVARPS